MIFFKNFKKYKKKRKKVSLGIEIDTYQLGTSTACQFLHLPENHCSENLTRTRALYPSLSLDYFFQALEMCQDTMAVIK